MRAPVFTIRARLLRSLRRNGGDERGFETAETVIVLPIVLILIFTIIQGALWYHSTNLVQAAASSAYESARLYGATSADGTQAGEATAHQAGSILSNVNVKVTRTANDATATVSADTPSLLPWVKTHVTKTITGPTERWVP